jgi:DNA-binding MarR family transcriptional regulator
MPNFDELLRRNASFARTSARERVPQIPFLPNKQVYILTCIDPRVDPAQVFGLELGDAIVARTVGGRVTPAVIQDLAWISYLHERTSHLKQHREANSTSLARALGESTGTTSYHLRQLAGQGFVEEVREKSGGRERWWRALPFQIQAPDPAKMAAAEWSAAVEHARAKAEHDIDLYFRVLSQYEGPEGWAQSSRGGFYMTKQELLAFYEEYIALQWKYGHTADGAPAGARPVALRFFAVPDDTALDGDGGELRWMA